MYKFEMTSEIFESLKVFAYIAEPHIFKNEYEASKEGFYWDEELGYWIDIDRSNEHDLEVLSNEN